MEKVSENMLKRTLLRGDPLLGLVEDRFRLLRQCPRSDDDDEEVFDRRLDELRRRIRRLDERIMRTVATSTHGLSSASSLRSTRKVRTVRVGAALR